MPDVAPDGPEQAGPGNTVPPPWTEVETWYDLWTTDDGLHARFQMSPHTIRTERELRTDLGEQLRRMVLGDTPVWTRPNLDSEEDVDGRDLLTWYLNAAPDELGFGCVGARTADLRFTLRELAYLAVLDLESGN